MASKKSQKVSAVGEKDQITNELASLESSNSEAGLTITLEEIRSLIGIVHGTDITHIKLTRGSHSFEFSRIVSETQQSPTRNLQYFVERPFPVEGTAKEQTGAHDDTLVKVESPMVGIFYRRPSPNEEPFVEVNSVVKEGDTLAIIEAMKVMNQVKSPVSGVIVEICVENGNMVEFGEVLFKIKKS
ncbi:MAG: acetyl-CoA carboxylase biotin carboxyl carrier protein [Deltaproteobacteria bacterium]|nr:acetyl-CoA carboxylase biotin carboxyl carrier protein [Deltaproteobacteria bacterium]